MSGLLVVLLSGCTTGSDDDNEETPQSAETDDEDEDETGNDGETDDDENGNGTPPELTITELHDIDLSNTDPGQTSDERFELRLQIEGDYDEAQNLELFFENQGQENVLQLDYEEELEVPVTELLAHTNQITASIEIDGQTVEASDNFKVELPSNYIIESRIDGETRSNTENEHRFAVHDLDQEEHEQRHREHTKEEYAWYQDRSGGEPIPEILEGNIPDYVDETDVQQLENATDFQEIMEYAGRIASDINQEIEGGINTSGREIAITARELASNIHDITPISIPVRHFDRDTGSGSSDGIAHINPETNEYFFQGVTGTRLLELGEETEGTRDYNFEENFSVISTFEPGDVDGVSYSQKSSATMVSLQNMSGLGVGQFTDTSGFMNDYFLDAATDHMLQGGDIYEVKDWIDQTINVRESIGQEDDLDTQYVGIAMDENESLSDAEIFVTDDQDVYEEVMENPTPTSKADIRNSIGLN